MVSKDLTTLRLQGKGERTQTRDTSAVTGMLLLLQRTGQNIYNHLLVQFHEFQHPCTQADQVPGQSRLHRERNLASKDKTNKKQIRQICLAFFFYFSFFETGSHHAALADPKSRNPPDTLFTTSSQEVIFFKKERKQDINRT